MNDATDTARLLLALALPLIINACAHGDEGKRFENFVGEDDRAAAWECSTQGFGWYRMEKRDLICYAHKRPDAFSVDSVLAQERVEHGQVRP